MTDSQSVSLYSFTVQDKDAEALTFGCIAESLEDAKRQASRAGHREILLLEVRPLEGAEIPEVGRRLAEENPLVGKDWLPLVDLMAKNVDLWKVGDVWILDIFPHNDPLAGGSPYAQALLEPEGSLHVEVGPTGLLKKSAVDNEDLAQWLGWKKPLDSGLPNYFQTFEPGTSMEFIAGTVIQSLTALFGVTTKDGFSVHCRRSAIQPVAGVELLDASPDYILCQPTFGLVGLHEVRFPPVESELVEEPPHTITRRSKSLDEL
jgi:hypothetical protein